MSCIRKILSGLLVPVVLMTGSMMALADEEESSKIHPDRRAQSTPVHLLCLGGPLVRPEAEVSGMTWKGDTLVVLPQNPELFGDTDMLGFFALSKKSILTCLADDAPDSLIPNLVQCQAAGMIRIIRGFDGLEAMGFMNDRVYLTVEAKEDTVMAGYLVCGHYDMVENQVVMDMTRMTSIPMGVNIPNVAEESMIIDGDRVITFSEANGQNIVENPKAKVFDKTINFLGSIPFPHIEYRVTDATALDERGRFWVINYFYPGEKEKLKPAPDPEVQKFGVPEGYFADGCVERLLELRLTDDDRIVRTETPPIYLQLNADGGCRNWEAMVRLDDRGFLLMTDKYPGTLFAFAANPYQN